MTEAKLTEGDLNPVMSESEAALPDGGNQASGDQVSDDQARVDRASVDRASGEIAASGKGGASRRKTRSLAERITLAVCAITLAAIVGLVLYDWQLSKNLPPAFQVDITESTRLTEGRYYVPFTLKNTGGRIARTVQVLADLQLPDGDEETGEQQFDFLSGNERKKGGFVFEHNPKDGELIVRVASFGLP